MKIFHVFIIILIADLSVTGQNSSLNNFRSLTDKVWKAEGKWGDGSPFFQEVKFSFALDSSIVVAHSNGFINQEQTEIGLRNIGIRQLDPETGTIKFWEFDVFGGKTEGAVFMVGQDILYQYQYGSSLITDMWEYIDEHTYKFIVGDYQDGKWNATYLETQFTAAPSSLFTMYKSLKSKLEGSWTSKAWSGQLNEGWYIDENEHLCQNAEYIEEGKVLYSAANKIEIVDNEMILFTVIRDGTPKIFKATQIDHDEITFENPDYSNPNKVVYRFKNENSFERTISGIENGEAVSYTFEFKNKK